jgi:hypothetical protein
MMSNYVITVYVSSDLGTYTVHIRLPSKTGCDTRLAGTCGAERYAIAAIVVF